MLQPLKLENYVQDIALPENLRLAFMIREQRKSCSKIGCPLDYYNFAFGESPFPVPKPIIESLKENAYRGNYSESQGIPELRKEVCRFYHEKYNLSIDPDRVFIGPGSKTLIHMILNSVEGYIIIPSPAWIGYFPQTKLLHKRFLNYRLQKEKDYKIQPSDLENLLKNQAKEQHLLLLNNPHNPTGAVYTKDELLSIKEICEKYNTFVIADEIYGLTTYQQDTFISMGEVYPEGTFVTGGLSKDRSSGGYRLGVCIMPENCSEASQKSFQKIASTVYTNVATPIQHAAITAYTNNKEIDEYIHCVREIHRIIGEYFSKEINRIPNLSASIPKGAFYTFVDFNGVKEKLKKKGYTTSNDVSKALIDHPYHIAVISGDACMLEEDDFGARLSFVDYDGEKALEAYQSQPPASNEEEDFIMKYAPRIVEGLKTLRTFISDLE